MLGGLIVLRWGAAEKLPKKAINLQFSLLVDGLYPRLG
jgi:hypothetical protein